MRCPFSRFLKFAAIVAIIVGSTLGVGGQRHRAKLSSDLLSFEARRTSGARPRHRARFADGNRSAGLAAWPGHRAMAGRLGGGARQQRADFCPRRRAMTCCRATRRLRRSWTCRTRRPRPIRCARGRRGLLLGLGAIPGVTGSGVTVAVVDTGISAHPALARKSDRQRQQSDRRSIDRRRAWPRHAHRRHHRRQQQRLEDTSRRSTAAASHPDVKLVNVRVLGADGTGWTSDVIAGIEWVIAESRQVQHSRDQSFARASGDRAVDHRSALPWP